MMRLCKRSQAQLMTKSNEGSKDQKTDRSQETTKEGIDFNYPRPKDSVFTSRVKSQLWFPTPSLGFSPPQ
jgi:hypothetical protein